MDLRELTQTEFDQHRIAVVREQERRDNLSRIPRQIEELTEKYLSEGGDPADLVPALEHP